MRFSVIFLSALILVGCGSAPKSSGIMKLGPDTYRVAAQPTFANVMENQKAAFKEAGEHCASLGREMMSIGTYTKEYAPFEVTYRCLKADDPQLKRPTLERAPDTVIQVK